MICGVIIYLFFQLKLTEVFAKEKYEEEISFIEFIQSLIDNKKLLNIVTSFLNR